MATPQEAARKVAEALAGRNERYEGGTVNVGFAADYALAVHEDLERKHPQGQAKYLEQPARLLAPVMRAVILEALQDGKTLVQALEAAGEILKAESQRLVPVQTGKLRDSAYVEVSTG